MSEKQGSKATAYKNQYNDRFYDALRIVVPKGRKADIEAHAQQEGVSVNGLVNNLLRGELKQTPEQWKAGAEDDEDGL